MKSPFDIEPETGLSVPERQFRDEGNGLLLAARRIEVTDQASYEQAVQFGKGISAFTKQVQEFFKPLKKAAKTAHQTLCDRETEILKIPLQADVIANRTATAWKVKAQQLDAAKKAQAELLEQKRQKLAAEYVAKGQLESAAIALQGDLSAPQAEVTPEYQAVSGTRSTVNWCCSIDSPELIPIEWRCPDEKRIREHVKTMREMCLPGGKFEIPGVRAWKEDKLHW